MASTRRLLLVRADADGRIGAGHVMRCLTLAVAWREEGGTARILTAGVPEWVRLRIDLAGIPVEILNFESGSEVDALATARRARDLDARAIVLDGAPFDDAYLRMLPLGPWRTAVVDDTGGIFSATDIVVNPNYGASADLYSGSDSSVRFFFGVQYAFLRREFRAARAPRRPRPNGTFRLLVTFGGGDTDSALFRFLEWLAPIGSTMEIRAVVTGEADRTEEKLSALLGAFLSAETIVEPQDMAACMRWADLVVIRAGGTLWEAMCVGTPVASFSINSVQGAILRRLSDDGYIVNLGEWKGASPAKVRRQLHELETDGETQACMSQAGMRLIDGFGVRRVAQLLAHP